MRLRHYFRHHLFPFLAYLQNIQIHIRQMKIPGLSFSLKRAIGITAAKQSVARKTGIPTTKAGLERKVGSMLLKAALGKRK